MKIIITLFLLIFAYLPLVSGTWQSIKNPSFCKFNLIDNSDSLLVLVRNNKIYTSSDKAKTWKELILNELNNSYIYNLTVNKDNSILVSLYYAKTKQHLNLIIKKDSIVTRKDQYIYPIVKSSLGKFFNKNGIIYNSILDSIDLCNPFDQLIDNGKDILLVKKENSFYSNDSGNTWNYIDLELFNNNVKIDKKFNIYSLGFNNHGIYLSNDTGANWMQIFDNVVVNHFFYLPENTLIAVTNSSVQISNSQSEGWFNSGLKDFSISHAFKNGNSIILYTPARQGFYISDDNGKTWSFESGNFDLSSINQICQYKDRIYVQNNNFILKYNEKSEKLETIYCDDSKDYIHDKKFVILRDTILQFYNSKVYLSSLDSISFTEFKPSVDFSSIVLFKDSVYFFYKNCLNKLDLNGNVQLVFKDEFLDSSPIKKVFNDKLYFGGDFIYEYQQNQRPKKLDWDWNLEKTKIVDFVLNQANHIFAKTSNNSLYKSLDYGKTWVNIDEGIPTNKYFNLLIDHNDILYIHSKDGFLKMDTKEEKINLSEFIVPFNPQDDFGDLMTINNTLFNIHSEGIFKYKYSENEIIELESPSNLSVLKNKSINLKWRNNPEAIKYYIQLSNSPVFFNENLLVNDSISNITNYAINKIVNDGSFYWRVRAKYADNSFSEWSDRWKFSINTSSNIITENNNDMFYPNPLNDQLYINSDEQIEFIEIYNIRAEQIMKIENPESIINLSSLNTGIYLLKARIGIKNIYHLINKY